MKGNLEKRIEKYSQMKKNALKQTDSIEFPVLYIKTNSNCNRRCKHCYINDYNGEDMDFKLLEHILRFSKKNGVFSPIFAGVEPLKVFDKLIAPLITRNEFKDSLFRIHTNGDLLDKKVADNLYKTNNTVVELSLDGVEEELLREKNSYKNTITAISLLKERNIPYGFFITITNNNFNKMENMTNHAINLGAQFIHLVGYKAIGPRVDINSMLSPEQEIKRYKLKKKIKEKHPYLSVPTKGCSPGFTPEGYFSYCPFLENLDTTKGEQITPSTSYNDISKLLINERKKFSILQKNGIECPLTENASNFVNYANHKGLRNPNDIFTKDSYAYKKAIEIETGFKELSLNP